MAYTVKNYRTKKELIADHKAGKRIEVFQPGGLFPLRPMSDGTVALEGPHYPEPHKWYASATIDSENCIVPGSKIR